MIYAGLFETPARDERVARCWLRLVQTRDGALVAIVTDMDQGPSVTNAAEILATAVRRRFCAPGQALLWWERYPARPPVREHETLDRVSFRWDGDRYQNPSWRPSSRAEVERFLGERLDLGEEAV